MYYAQSTCTVAMVHVLQHLGESLEETIFTRKLPGDLGRGLRAGIKTPSGHWPLKAGGQTVRSQSGHSQVTVRSTVRSQSGHGFLRII